jgi:hypothetical protein
MSLPQVPVRKLGGLGLLASAQGLGCMSMSNSYLTNYTHTDEDSIATIHRALELGVTFLGRFEFIPSIFWASSMPFDTGCIEHM